MLVPFLVTSTFECTALGIWARSKWEWVWVGLGQGLSGRPSLIISVWLPRLILSKRFWPGRLVALLLTSHDCTHSGCCSLLKTFSKAVICLSTLFICEDGIVVEGRREQLTSLMHCDLLGDIVRDDLVEASNSFTLDFTSIIVMPMCLSGACVTYSWLQHESKGRVKMWRWAKCLGPSPRTCI